MTSEKLNHLNFTQKELDNLFNSSKNGDTAAFGKLSGIVRDISYSYFLSKHRQGKITNKTEVDDLTNNVYLAFAEQFEKVDNLEFWLRRVLFLNFINWYKKTKANKSFDLDQIPNLSGKDIDPAVKIDADKILSLLNNISEDKQQILKMRFWEDLKFSEIAENLNKSEDAVKKMFYRTIIELREML